MKLIYLALLLAFTLSASMDAQNLYIPRDVQAAYKKGTRSMDGKPGKNYFQNFGRYDIAIQISPPNRNIKGSETIVYYNNSADTIKNPILKLILNAHTAGATRTFPAAQDQLTSGVHITAVTENGVAKPWKEAGGATFQRFRLSKPLPPRDS